LRRITDAANPATTARASSPAPRRCAHRAAQPHAGPRNQKPKLPRAACPGSGKGMPRRRPCRAGFARRRTPAAAVGEEVEVDLLAAARVSTRVARREPFECCSGHTCQHLKLVTETFSRVDSIKMTEHHPTVHMVFWGNDVAVILTRLLATNNQMECTYSFHFSSLSCALLSMESYARIIT
jgi:hypothetical protein